MKVSPKDHDEFVAIARVLTRIRTQLDKLIDDAVIPPFPADGYSNRDYEEFQQDRHRYFGHQDGLQSALIVIEREQNRLYASLLEPGSRELRVADTAQG